ncbi:hypothetical protein C8J57DRAFT_1247867 [Mycena rebaudengoi]|nr:hypothetical protein C8J57DRAFT_1247867 [Mycena rebaudengoi]
MLKLFSLPTLLLASLAIGVVVSTPLEARNDGCRICTQQIPPCNCSGADTRRASSFRRLASSARTQSVSHPARVPPVLGIPHSTNKAEVIWVILDGKRGYSFTCLERYVASIEKVLNWYSDQSAL